VTFNFFVLHRPELSVTIAVALLLLLLRPGTNRCNELPLIGFLFPTTRLSCLWGTGCALFKRTIIIFIESEFNDLTIDLFGVSVFQRADNIITYVVSRNSCSKSNMPDMGFANFYTCCFKQLINRIINIFKSIIINRISYRLLITLIQADSSTIYKLPYY